MQFLDPYHPFLLPLWRRIAVVVTCIGWSGVEFYNDAPAWGMLFLGAGVYSGFQFFVGYDPEKARKAEEEKKSEES